MRFDIDHIERTAKSALEEEGSFGWQYGGREIACVPTVIIEMAKAIRTLEAGHVAEMYRLAKQAFIAGALQSPGNYDREKDFDLWWDKIIEQRKDVWP